MNSAKVNFRSRIPVVLLLLVLFLLLTPASIVQGDELLPEGSSSLDSTPTETLSPFEEGDLYTIPENPVEAVMDSIDEVLNPDPAPQDPPEEGEPPNESPPPADNSSGSESDQSSAGGSIRYSGSEPYRAQSNPVGSSESSLSESMPASAAQPRNPVALHRFLTANYEIPPKSRTSDGSRSTQPVLKLLKKANASPSLIAKILAPFPVAGPASYGDDWGNPRHDPAFHLHEGTDIFAERGTPVIAAVNGILSRLTRGGQIGGNSFRLTGPDGTYYYYSHLDGFISSIREGMSVTEGQVLGFVGTSGNAEGGAAHLHFEIHPNGGSAVPPVPYLDRWLEEAMTAGRALQASAARGNQVTRALSAAGEGASDLAKTAVRSIDVKGVSARSGAIGWGLVLLAGSAILGVSRRRVSGYSPVAEDWLAGKE